MTHALVKPLQLTLNDKPVAAFVEPRTHLADFLREAQLLTGTNIGCEQGVCGACTVQIDGAPARSCITPAIACAGSQVRTIEGFDDDALMNELRAAFSAEHALQCGYCTPGMLVTAHDIVTRVPDADDARVRYELSGNLCRCTGYVGIVRAIRRVLDARRAAAAQPHVPAAAAVPAVTTA
ncbi:(2Fe-2S)-binding protein [Paraburkholderia rhizosphaerae]|uniref:Carbon-monoxide dehydrogenase small subunit n=1 Tax=Paraburkholderia rhizosphaerae TaxID=480658 RepID=A0A4R8LH37_9BURK|nr:(2Fe-2S)-binding protein [Paraburkholderia rhizosphaerae]TDY42478.1 carbon-monoxide dehydrogenase small subunit [Paraburkholderia rhizosphaerae]